MVWFVWGVAASLVIDILLAAVGQDPIPLLLPLLAVTIVVAIGASYLQRRWSQTHPAGESMAASLVSALHRSERLQAHEANLKQALARIPYGRPAEGQIVWWDALHEHLPKDLIWVQEPRLMALYRETNGLERTLSDHSFNERRDHGLLGRTGPDAILRIQMEAIRNGTVAEFPDQPWFVEDGNLLKLGRNWGVLEVANFDEAVTAINAINQLWSEIPLWPELARIRELEAATANLKLELDRHITDLINTTPIPGSCHMCRSFDPKRDDSSRGASV